MSGLNHHTANVTTRKGPWVRIPLRPPIFYGGMAERFKAAVPKTEVEQFTVSSNLTPSAKSVRIPNDQCPTCNSPVYRRPAERVRYCGQSCYDEQKPRKRPRTCAQCGEKIGPKAASDARFCSIRCSNIGRRGIAYDGERARCKVVQHVRLKRELIAEHGERCVKCGIGPEWNDQPLTLQMDHINGNRANRDKANLRLLCPNCHSQTPTYAGRKSRASSSPGRASVLQTEGSRFDPGEVHHSLPT